MDKTLKTPVAEDLNRTIASPMNNTVKTCRAGGVPPAKNDAGSEFVLKGKVYQIVRCLSDDSGEALVFLVSSEGSEYVLKVYYPNFSIKKKLLKIIRNFDFEMIVKLYDFGKTYIDGKNRDYELMEYLKGQTLTEFKLEGDFNRFRRIALQAAAALAYCHNNNIIHKDIKPGNFFFRDEEHTQLVLGDFGISSILDSDEHIHRTTQARTPLYAAPEMYNDVIDGEVDISPAVDYYSLGLTLLTLWYGENPLSSNERAMMRKKNEGRIPKLNELPDRVRMIIQGLTTVNPQRRWAYDEVERWFLGENVEVDISSPLLKYKSFVVDPERNLVADNVQELVPLLVENERIAVGYLYGGRISDWLESCGNTKLSTVVKDIVKNRYPADQSAGLMAAVYTMDPAYPYRDLRGNLCDDIHTIVMSMLTYSEEYALALKNPNDRLWLYVESHAECDIERLRSYFKPGDGFDGRVAVIRVAFELDPDIPFMAIYPTATLQEIVKVFGYNKVTEDDWQSLTDGRLLSWMYGHEDPMACESLRILTEGHPYSKQLAYKVLYNIDREAAYDLQHADTPQKIGELLKQQLIEWQYLNDEEFAGKIADFSDENGRFCYFAQMHGWLEQLGEARNCFDLKSEENRERLSAYDLRTAAYRFCRILGAEPVYILEDGTELANGSKLSLSRRSVYRSEMRKGSFSQWLSIWYHEDPYSDFSEEYSYERSLEKWLRLLGEIDQQNLYYKRFVDAKKQTAQKVAKFRSSYRRAKSKEITWNVLFYGLSAAWILLLLTCGISNIGYVLQNSFYTVILPVGGITAVIVWLKAFFNGYGFILSCLWGALGMASSYLSVWILKYVNASHPSWLVWTAVALTLVYVLVCRLTDYRLENTGEKKMFNEIMDDDINSSLLEPLYFTFKQRSYRFKGSKFGVLDDIQNQVNSSASESVIHYMLWSVMMAMLIAEMVMFSPQLMNIKNPELDKFKVNPKGIVEEVIKDVE